VYDGRIKHMTVRTQKFISAILIGFVVVGGLEALLVILNLNQIRIYLQVATAIYFYLIIKITLLYDLHFKNPGALDRARSKHENVGHWLSRSLKILGSACWDRINHLRSWQYARHWLNYLILPTFLFWATVVMFYLNFGYLKIQQMFFLLSSIALIMTYWYLKEVFIRKLEKVEGDIFVALSVVKIYTVAICFAAAMGLLRSYCVPGVFYAAIVGCLTFLFMYQALFQHNRTNINTLLITVAISLLMTGAGFFVYVYWGLNYYTAAIFMAALYNFFWGVFHYRLDHALSWRSFAEILVMMLLVATMVFSVTNFKARLLDGCLQQSINFNL
jgi:hypothetical protein